jgi:hypothetical protein
MRPITVQLIINLILVPVALLSSLAFAPTASAQCASGQCRPSPQAAHVSGFKVMPPLPPPILPIGAGSPSGQSGQGGWFGSPAAPLARYYVPPRPARRGPFARLRGRR